MAISGHNCMIALVLFFIYHQASAKCVPGAVENVSLADNYTLSWSAAENVDKCNISNYVIYVKDIAEGTLQLFNTDSARTLYYNMSFLDYCTSYTFEVHAQTNVSVLGPATAHAYTTAPSANMNLTLDMHSIYVQQEQMTISWSLVAPEVSKCVNFYRLVYWDEDDKPTDVYVYNTSYVLRGEVPCMKYEFQVRAIVGTPEIEGPFSLSQTTSYGQVPSPPKIVSISTTNDTATLVWATDSYEKNRCPVLYLVAETLGTTNTPLQVPYNDNTTRPTINYTLTKLKPDYAYTSYVHIVNSMGSSKKITALFQTLDNNSTRSNGLL